MNFILFNGPPGSGKDTAAMFALTYFQNDITVKWEKFSFPNKLAFAGLTQRKIDRLGNVQDFEREKEQIIPSFGVSYRQWQIDFSEKFMKPLYGPKIFAKLLLDRQRVRLNAKNYLCLVSDCGFQVEVDTLVEHLNPKNVLLITLRREGCDFSKDSRQWVDPPYGVSQYILNNNTTISELRSNTILTIKDWLDAKKCNAPSSD